MTQEAIVEAVVEMGEWAETATIAPRLHPLFPPLRGEYPIEWVTATIDWRCPGDWSLVPAGAEVARLAGDRYRCVLCVNHAAEQDGAA